ncbi:MAG: hypothetical protein A2W93_13535 [Bacteroidetes bacterium GWF2_43_63]|nr:MAG: hypothetical protein A2W94_03730 [Bacteroidetes bacterium GWE2_42_42]OFY55012.1 MAG: hypothetical protein A2W93_13535 [Bacteroidetes bacterium GWF2_43_63]HBG69547.1 hypothetical protein [Bacteroidales bacterium]HCB60714.1 hypothetical protein [Bacteroidales bacterium]HCY23982.1 hypothetical protein [Bacteroidales bacterium]
MRITIAILILLQISSLIGCASKDFKEDSRPDSKKEILVYSSDSASIFTYDPENGESKQILALNKEIVPETFRLINDSLLTFTTLENMLLDSVLKERKYTDSNNVVQSYLSTTNYYVVTEKVHLISLSDGRHYIPQVNEYYVHEFQSQKFSTYGFPGILTFCVSDTITDHGRYYVNDDSCERYILTKEFFDNYEFMYSESKTINGVKLVTFRGNLILIHENRIAGIHHYDGTFSQKAGMIGYYTPDISGNGFLCAWYYKSHIILDIFHSKEYPDNGIFICNKRTGKQKRIAGLEYNSPKLSAEGDFIACGSKKEYYEYNYTESELITVFDLSDNTHVCIGEGHYYEWANK